MLGSMYSAVSGLQAHQTKMNVIGNNIANVNTYGFKSSRVTFSDVFYQTLGGASSASEGEGGGTNPTQLGYGAKVGSIDVLTGRSGSTTTGRGMDVYINGDGYLAVKASDDLIKYTRVGILSFDTSGSLVDSNGSVVQGYVNGSTTVSGITLDSKELAQYSAISIGPSGEITGTKEGDPKFSANATNAPWITGSTVANTSTYTGDVKISNVTSTVGFTPGSDAATGATALNASGMTVEGDANMNGDVSISYDGTTYTMHYTDKNEVAKTATLAAAPLATPGGNLTFTVPDTATPTAGTATVTVPYITPDGTHTVLATDGTKYSLGNVASTQTKFTVSVTDELGTTKNFDSVLSTGATGFTAGDLGFTVDFKKLAPLSMKDLAGSIGTVGAGDSISKTFASIAIAKVANPDGLTEAGDSYYTASANSGVVAYEVAGTNGTGSLLSGSLEMSNVDLSREFTDMITAQRGFQANTKMITVSDEMLEQLVNMKR